MFPSVQEGAVRRVAVSVPLLVFLLGGVLASCSETASHNDAPGNTATPSAHTAQPALASSKHRPLPRCSADDVRITVALTGSAMSQPFSDIAITNTGSAPCLLRGYPRITVWGHPGFQSNKTPSTPLGIAVHHGLYERADRGPRRVVVPPRHEAYFSVGTVAAYQGGAHPITLTRLAVTLPGTDTAKTLAISLLATRPPGQHIPIGITALRRSRP